MNFNTIHFLIFISFVLTGYFILLKRTRSRELLLLTASYYFYMSWNWKYAFILILVTLVNYTVGRLLSLGISATARRWSLAGGISVSLLVLCIFKYFNFFMESIESAGNTFNIHFDFPSMKLLLPIGISFYTFQGISYLIEVYRNEIAAEHDFIKFALFKAYFPQLVAGPIVRASLFLPQFHKAPNVTEQRFMEGMAQVFKGLFKKIVIADLLAFLAIDQVFKNPSAFSSIDLILALYGYSFQIYNDFSGYSDIAIGIARMMGFDLPKNFNKPYHAQDIREFWKRWHITLSTWFRDFLYIPLGGNRCSVWRTYLNLSITMLLCGLWHGAALNFIIWGAYHALFQIINRLHSFHRKNASFTYRCIAIFICFHIITFGWLLFRASSMTHFADFLKGLASMTFEMHISNIYILLLFIAAICHFVPDSIQHKIISRFIHLPILMQALCYASLIILFCGCNLGAPNFIYFQF